MTERIHEIVEDACRWLKEAWVEWRESVSDSWEAHCYTLALGALLAQAVRWMVS